MVARLTNGAAFLNLLILLAASVLEPQPALAQNFITIDYPGATETFVSGINNHGVIAGVFDGNRGFVLQNGVFTNIDFPNASFTLVFGINDSGDVVGSYYEGNAWHGFLLSQGVYTTIDRPTSPNTVATGINNVGQIVGGSFDSTQEHGFLLSGGVYTDIEFPSPGSTYTQVNGINNAGAMVGEYEDSSGNLHGFLFQSGTFASIDYPGCFVQTSAKGINDGGQIDGRCESFGFEYNPANPNSPFTIITFPVAVGGAVGNGINNAGQLVGTYSDAAQNEHGFVSTTGPFAYVANLGSDTVSMIDISTSLPVAAIPVGSEPLGVAVSPDGKQVYVSNYIGNSVSVIDTASNAVVATIPGLSSPRGMAFTPPDGAWAYVANPGANNVAVIDTALQAVVATVPIPDAIGVAMALTSNGTFAYVTNANGSVSVVAVGSSPAIVKTIPVGTLPIWVAVTPNSSLAYVVNQGSNNVSVISVASNTVTATIPVGTGPNGDAFTPDGSFAYVTNSDSNTVSVIDTATNSVVKTVSGFNIPYYVALSTDGASAYVTNVGANVSVIDTASNTITGTVGAASDPYGIAIAQVPQTELQITQPLSPTQPNNFNFGTNNYQVQYPPGTNFSNVNMTVTEVPITQAHFQQRVAGIPQFANASCIAYAGAGGNCVDYQVTCSDNSGTPINCPTASAIDVQTSFTTSQSIFNPGFLKTPIGQDLWQNIFNGYAGVGPLITIKGKTTGFSEFVAVDLGAPQGQSPDQIQVSPQFPLIYSQGQVIPISIQLTSVDPPHKPDTVAQASISVVMTANGNGNPLQQVVFSKAKAFKQGSKGVYNYSLDATAYAAGTYSVTIYGDAFPAYQGQFTIKSELGAAVLVAKPTSLTFPVQEVGFNSAPLRDSLFNEGSAQGIVSSVETTGDFQIQTNHCVNGVKPATHCDVYIVFSPTAVGMRTGTLSYYDNASGSPQTVSLSGVGTLTRPTTTTLTSSTNSSTYGQAVTFTAVVAPAPPDGEGVSFMKGKMVLGTGTLSGGSASFTTSALSAGMTSFTAVYGGDSNFASSTSKAVSQVVSKATTTTNLTSSHNPSTVGQSVIFTASVTPQLGGKVTGPVNFYDGTTLLKTVAVSGGAAKFTSSTLTSGAHNITAVYGGDSNNSGSTSTPVNQFVLAATTTTLTSSPNPSAYGQTVVFTATVTSSMGAPPDGETVAFRQGAIVLGTGTLSGGTTTLSISTLVVGTKAVTAVYGGDSKLGGSTSKAVSQVVSKATTTTALAASQNPSNVGQSVSFTANVTPQFSGKVTGTVSFYDGTTLLKTVALTGSMAKFTTSVLTAGTHSIKATYNGSASFDGSSGSLTQTVN